MWHHQKQPGYQQKNKSKIGSKAMADECSFCGEWCSRATVEDSLALARTDRKEMDLCPIRVFFKRKPSFFDKPAPKSNSQCPATSTWWKHRLFSVLIGHAEWYTHHHVVCFTHNHEQERVSSFNYRLPAPHGDDVIIPPAIVIFSSG